MTKDSVPVVFVCDFELAMNHHDRRKTISSKSADNFMKGMFNYLSNKEKKAMNMFDYYMGRIKHKEETNLILSDGSHATDEDVKKLKEDYLSYFQNSNLYRGIISFDANYINNSIEFSELEKKIMKDVMPRFLKHCGFEDINKMSYVASLHTNTDNLHFHISFIEKEPNYINSKNEVGYRRKGKLSLEECNFLKNEVLHVIDRHREFTPLVKKTNLEIDKLKQYFNPKERNYILRDRQDLILEENILRLGKLLDKKRENQKGRIKFNSIYDKEIKDLTKNIKTYLFKNKNSSLYKKDKEFKESLKELNTYFIKLNKENHNKRYKFKNDYVKNKEEYIDNYIFNSIVNNAYFRYKKLKENKNYISSNDIIEEAVLKQYKKNKKESRFNILLNYLSNSSKESQFRNKYKIENSIKKINEEMEDAKNEFSKLFQNDNEKER